MSDRPGNSEDRLEAADAAEKRTRIEEDLVLIDMIQGGSVTHWHALVDRYSGLIYSVIRRQLFAEDDDDVRTVFADVLAALYKGKLAEFKGRSALSTWLIVVSRGMALDHLRKRDGRRKMPKGHEDLTPVEQKIFKLHNVEGLRFELVIQSLNSAGMSASPEAVANAIMKIESMFDRNYLNRLEYEAKAPALGVVSGRLLDFMQRMQLRHERTRDETPDAVFETKQIQEAADHIRDLLSNFSRQEQDVMRLRFDEEMTAKDISDQLGLGGQRKVYTIIDGVARRIRKLLGQ